MCALLVPVLDSCKKDEAGCDEKVNALKINQLQVLGSHNSYQVAPVEPILQFMYANPQMLPEGFNPGDWDFSHVPFAEQLNTYGIRSLELDVFDDPNGGLFYNRMGLAILGMSPESNVPELQQPGLKVLHFPDLDFQTYYYTFKSALNAVKAWSEQHPDHVPLVILVEPKEDNPYAMLGAPFTNTLPFNAASLGTIDQEIKDVFGAALSGIITPDQVRGSYATLNEAVLRGNWPEMFHARGKIMFVMDGSGNETADYLDGHPSLQNRAMFVFAEAGRPEAAFLKYEDPRGFETEIRNRVTEGYIVRTRADADTKEARSGDVSRRDAAFLSGAQIISTDYYRPDPRGGNTAGWTNYSVQLPGAFKARPNPVNGSENTKACTVDE